MWSFKKIQVGLEATAGTKVAATSKLMGRMTTTPQNTKHRPEDEHGSLAPYHRTVIVGEQVEHTFEGDLTFEQVMYLLAACIEGQVEGDTATPTGVKHGDAAAFDDMTNAFDDSTSTDHTLVGFVAAEDYLYIRSATKFRAVKVNMGATVNAVAATLTITCSDGASGWLACTLVKDGTLDAAGSTKTLAKDGTIEFTPHASWATDNLDSDNGYWIRIAISANLTANVLITEIDVVAFITVWTFEPALTSANTPQSLTIEDGDDVQEYESEYGVVSEMTISGELDSVLLMKATLFARNLSPSSFTTGLSNPASLESALMNKTKVFVDTSGAAIGSNELSATLISFSFKIPGFKPVKHGGATLYFDSVLDLPKAVELSMKLKFTSSVEAQRLLEAAGTRGYFQILTTGSLIAGSDYNKLTINLAGTYDAWGPLTNQDGETVVDITVVGEYDPTWTKLYQVIVNNETGMLV